MITLTREDLEAANWRSIRISVDGDKLTILIEADKESLIADLIDRQAPPVNNREVGEGGKCPTRNPDGIRSRFSSYKVS